MGKKKELHSSTQKNLRNNVKGIESSTGKQKELY